MMNPPQSSDLTEAVWDHLERRWNKRQPTSKEELWDVLHKDWRTIPGDYLKKWQESSSERVQAALKDKCARAKYRLLSRLEMHKPFLPYILYF